MLDLVAASFQNAVQRGSGVGISAQTGKFVC
jgi:hypothetical protein